MLSISYPNVQKVSKLLVILAIETLAGGHSSTFNLKPTSSIQLDQPVDLIGVSPAIIYVSRQCKVPTESTETANSGTYELRDYALRGRRICT